MRWIPLVVVLIACGDPKAQPDAAPDPDAAADTSALLDVPVDADPNNPPTLADTGLCVDAACTQIQPGIKAYKPHFELYSDGATKKRWIWLPPGTQIDTSNMDFWQFPVGTKVWKEFTRDGVRVETRLVMRISDTSADPDADWLYTTYVWNQAQDATTAETFGVPDANGTMHDVPSRSMCKTCHNNTSPSRVLGFSAIQLDWDNPDASAYDLASLVTDGKLTAPPSAPTTPGAYFPLPGNTTVEQPVLGYLHANCGHCHNPSSKVTTDNGVQMQLRLTVGALGSVMATPAYSTSVGIDGTTSGIGGVKKLITAGNPAQSQMTLRFESTQMTQRMPALGTEVMDPVGQSLLRTWITGLP